MDRQQRIVNQLKAEGLDALLIVSPTGTTYLSGCYLLTQIVIPEREAYVLITASGEASYLVCNLEAHSAERASRIADIHQYVEFAEEPAHAAARLLRQKGLTNGKIGMEASKMTYAGLAHLQRELPLARFVDWEAQFGAALMFKEPAEVEALTMAGQATRAAIENGMRQASPGSSELEVSNRILSGIMAAGIMPLFNVFASGPQIMETHAVATNRTLRPGDIVRIDMGGRLSRNNYLSDMARTAVVGEATAEQRSIYRRLSTTQTAVFEAIRPGIPISDLYHICVDTYAREGLPFQMPHIGHGMGIGLHEAPMINGKNDTLLAEGMVLNIEPFVKLPERQETYHIEDLAVVTADGCRLLTTPHPDLISIPA